MPRVLVLTCLVLAASVTSDAATGDGERARRIESMYAEYKARSFPSTPDLRVPEVRAWRDTAAVVLLDVRSERERRVSTLPDALDPEAFERRRAELAGLPVVVYCTVGYRSGLAARDLRAEGVEAYNLVGGILAWAHAGGEVVDASGHPTRRVHVYGRRWSLLPEHWEAVLR